MAGYIFRAIFNHAEQLLLHETELVSAFNVPYYMCTITTIYFSITKSVLKALKSKNSLLLGPDHLITY